MQSGKKILIVDDDNELRQSLGEQLRLHEEFEVAEADSGGTALETTKTNHYDAILLDVGLPDMDGREVCRLMRRNGVKVPIVMLTGADSEADTILGLHAGANDYVTKPFRLGVLLARLRRICASTSRARTRSSRLAHIISSRAPRCWSNRRPKKRSG